MSPSTPSSPTAPEPTQPDTSHLRRPLRSSSRRQVSRANSRRIINDPNSAAELARATSVITNTKVSLRDAMAMAFSIKPGTQDAQKAGTQATSPKAGSTASSPTKQGQAAKATTAGSTSAAGSPRTATAPAQGQNQSNPAQRNKPRMARPSTSSRNLNPGGSRPLPVRSATFNSSSSLLSRDAELHQLRLAVFGAPTIPTLTGMPMSFSRSAVPATQLLPPYCVEQASFSQLQLSAPPSQQPSSQAAPEPATSQQMAGVQAMEQRCGDAAAVHAAAKAEPSGWSCWSSDFSSCLQQAAGI
jgi:hypothetical protein